MGTMRFMQITSDPKVLPKIFSFDSSPGRAIAQAIGAGIWDERSYEATLVEDREDERVYEIRMAHKAPSNDPSRVMPLQKVGMITYRPIYDPRREQSPVVVRPTLA